MKRGMHFMCWFDEDWNYHPGMPMKRLQQIEDIVGVEGKVLLWSCLGSGAIGLPYLDREANEEVSPRLRFYGFLNDREFCQECSKRGITAYGVVWKAQLWEFPAEFNDDGSELLALNKLRGTGKKGWLGVKEMSENSYPKLFNSMDKYFPEGLVNSDGEKVHNFLEEFKCRTLDNGNIFSSWLMVPGHDHLCYTPCCNNPAYMAYLKKEIEMMIDAGAGGILIDETDTNFLAAKNSGCFCKDCIKGFREYLRNNTDANTDSLDLTSFDYQSFLKEKGCSDADLAAAQGSKRWKIPFYKEFWDFQIKSEENCIKILRNHTREYAKQKNIKDMPFTANLFNCLPHTSSLRKYLDYVAGEKSGIKLRQDGWYRFAKSFIGDKESCFIEDPNDHVLDILSDIKNGISDAYILFMLEPLAHGANIAIPYGSWLMNFKKDSFYPDMEVERKMGKWLMERENLFTNKFISGTAVVYDQRSAYERQIYECDYLDMHQEAGFKLFHNLCQELCNYGILFNVLYVSSEEPLTYERLKGYKNMLMPDVCCLSESESSQLFDWVDSGGRIGAMGRVHPSLNKFALTIRHPLSTGEEIRNWMNPNNQQQVVQLDRKNVGMSVHKTETGYALHLINYNLNNITRKIEAVDLMRYKLLDSPRNVKIHSFPGPCCSVEYNDQTRILEVERLGIYTIIEFEFE